MCMTFLQNVQKHFGKYRQGRNLLSEHFFLLQDRLEMFGIQSLIYCNGLEGPGTFIIAHT